MVTSTQSWTPGEEPAINEKQFQELVKISENKTGSEISQACNNALSNYEKEALTSNFFRKRGEKYYEPCSDKDPDRIEMTYDKIAKGCLYPRKITFEDAAKELKKNVKLGNAKADQELMKFRMKNS